MNSGLQFLSLLGASLMTPVAATLMEEAAPPAWGWIVSTGALASVYIALGALSVGGEKSRTAAAVFLIGVFAVAGAALDVAMNPLLRGFERNLWPLEIALMGIIVWLPLGIGVLLRQVVRRRRMKPDLA
jgi:hypothetical protein